MPTFKKVNLLEIFKDYNPKVLSNGQIRMKCPFRENHTDGSGRMSFFVHPGINAYHCFSCKRKGNLVSLLTTFFKVGYFEAVEMVHITDYVPDKKEFELDIMWNTDKLPDEFIERGYSVECLKHFKIGMTNSGFIVIPYYDNFKCPSDLLGYQKRKYGKNRWVTGSEGFDKKNYLYNLDTSYDYVILVEGQSDVWRLNQHGYNSCALDGSDISKFQVMLLANFKRVYLALDNDLPGRRGIEICNYFLRNYVDVMLIPYPFKDPGECADKSEWDECFNSSTDYLNYSMEMAVNWVGYVGMRDEVLNMLSKRV